MVVCVLNVSLGEFISTDVLMYFCGESGGFVDNGVVILEWAYGLVMTESQEALLFVW